MVYIFVLISILWRVDIDGAWGVIFSVSAGNHMPLWRCSSFGIETVGCNEAYSVCQYLRPTVKVYLLFFFWYYCEYVTVRSFRLLLELCYRPSES